MPANKRASGAVFIASFLVVGVPYWLLPYAGIALPNSLLGLPVVAVIVIAIFARAYLGLGFPGVLVASGAAFPAAVLARIIVETVASPTTHNLWPFEVIIAALTGLLLGTLGSWLGGLVRKRVASDAGEP